MQLCAGIPANAQRCGKNMVHKPEAWNHRSFRGSVLRGLLVKKLPFYLSLTFKREGESMKSYVQRFTEAMM